MLAYTGHPLVDVGIATITAFSGRSSPSELTEADLDRIADYIESEYPKNPLKSFLGVAFTTNAWFNQPAFDKAPEKRKDYARRIVRAYKHDEASFLTERCAFTGLPAVDIAFSDKLQPGRAYRQHIPLLTGEGVVNFFPWGDTGLPVSGHAILAIQAFPLGCAKVGGKLLAVHSTDAELMQDFASDFLDWNLRAISLAQRAGSTKMPEAGSSARTLLIKTLLRAEERRRAEAEDLRPASVTAYHLTNSGQSDPLDRNNPPLEIYHLPLQLTRFLATCQSPAYRNQWDSIANRAWWNPGRKKSQRSKEQKAFGDKGEEDVRQRNALYEDLFRLPDNAGSFIRLYFLRIPIRSGRTDDPRSGYSLRQESDLVSWKLTELFLREVVEMNKDRINAIRDLGERLASYVSSENDKRFFGNFFAERNYEYFRNTLIKANLACAKRGNPPLIGFDPYVEIFEEGYEVPRADWRLARDLVLIRMIEVLHEQGWLSRHRDILPEDVTESDAETVKA